MIDADALESIPESGASTITIVRAPGVTRLDKVLAQQLAIRQSRRTAAPSVGCGRDARVQVDANADETVLKIQWAQARKEIDPRA